MAGFDKGRLVHAAFTVGVVLKGIDGSLELIGAVLLLVASRRELLHWVAALTQHELSRDPHDFFASHLLHATEHLSTGVKTFGAIYLLAHGLVKVGLVWALLKTKLWAYPLAIAVFLAFAAYQLYRYTLSHPPSMLVLTALDVGVIALTWAEYRRVRREAHPAPGR